MDEQQIASKLSRTMDAWLRQDISAEEFHAKVRAIAAPGMYALICQLLEIDYSQQTPFKHDLREKLRPSLQELEDDELDQAAGGLGFPQQPDNDKKNEPT